ncbi:MAG: hypothetical protein FJ335_13305 [Sphingomonadales bacterium]|nr:hypothetical protein [Sphingomonadales bacterium]
MTRARPATTLPPDATGADLHAAIVAEARRRGVTPRKFVKPMSCDASTWLEQVSRVARPRPATLARVIALLSDQPIPPPTRRRIVRTARAVAVDGTVLDGEPPVPAVLPFERRSCPWCGVRSDIGCRHLGQPERAAE